MPSQLGVTLVKSVWRAGILQHGQVEWYICPCCVSLHLCCPGAPLGSPTQWGDRNTVTVSVLAVGLAAGPCWLTQGQALREHKISRKVTGTILAEFQQFAVAKSQAQEHNKDSGLNPLTRVHFYHLVLWWRLTESHFKHTCRWSAPWCRKQRGRGIEKKN